MSRQPLVFDKVNIPFSPSDLIKYTGDDVTKIFLSVLDKRNRIVGHLFSNLGLNYLDSDVKKHIRCEYSPNCKYGEVCRFYYKDELILEFLGLETITTDVCITIDLKYKIYPLELDNV